MATITGIELGPDSCSLVAVRTLGATTPEVIGVRCLAPPEWPAHDVARSEKLQSVRQKGRMPRTARVVAWGQPDGAKADDPMVQAALRPLTEAGFRLETVSSPAEALARLAFSRRPSSTTAAAWIALNTFGAAIAIVRGRDLLFSRAFEWSFRPQRQPGARSELLQRYTLIAHLAPEVQRGIAMVREAHGVTVETVVTCGDLPDLRSLTMPLIEELDLEVETLDSADGLRASKRVSREELDECAPAIRLAHAVATAPAARQRPATQRSAAAAAIVVSLLGLAAFGYWLVSRPQSTPASSPTQVRSVPPKPAAPPPQQNRPAPTDTSARAATAPAPPTTAVPPAPEAPRVERPAAPAPVGQVARNREDNRTIPRAEGTQGVRTPALVSAPRRTKVPAALKEPLPVVESILVAATRRLAVVDGLVVSVGDAVGSRTVTAIERDYIVLTEPSGLSVRVQLRR